MTDKPRPIRLTLKAQCRSSVVALRRTQDKPRAKYPRFTVIHTKQKETN